MKQFLKRISFNPLVWFSDNFYPVQKGMCYRTKTLRVDVLERYIKQYAITNILNIREADDSAAWYQQEQACALKNGVLLHTVSLNEKVTPTSDQLQKILQIFSQASGPLLIHCRAGADRTGMISALWVLEKMNGTLAQALAQQTLYFGHIRWIYPNMRRFIMQWHGLRDKFNGDVNAVLHYLTPVRGERRP